MTTEQQIIRGKVGLLELAKQLGNVSQACKVMGYSRDSFYRFKDLYDTGGEAALAELTRRKPNLHNRIAEPLEARIVALAIAEPAWGQIRAASELAKEGHRISPGGVRCVWVRHDLGTRRKRLLALEARAAQEGWVLTEGQVAALEQVQRDKEAHGEFASECPGYCGAQDTFYVGTLKGVGRIYQHTRTRTKRPQTNGICERFNKTVLNEFYRVAFRKTYYTTLEQLQADLDRYLDGYNADRPHQGRWCYGKTPLQTFTDSIPLAKEKLIA